ncbi:MAG: hypothetical protein ACRYGC_06170 [Janthinobacterium lividum]
MHATRRLPACLALAAVALAASAGAVRCEDAAQALSGRYGEHFANGDVDGRAYDSDDVVEIVPVGQGAAYLRIELAFFNGHTCSLSGIGAADGGRIVYEDAEPDMPGAPPCVLTVSRDGATLLVDDADGSCKAHCGVRGSLSNVTLPFASRRPIRYMARLKASREYADALRAWQKKPGAASTTRKGP